MTDIEAKALALLDEVCEERDYVSTAMRREHIVAHEALCRAIEQHEAFKQEVSDEAQEYEEAGFPMGWEGFERFIIPKPKPDPLVEVMKEAGWADAVIDSCAPSLRAALEARGLEIREKDA